jgi:AcrR family transcriptional regulator
MQTSTRKQREIQQREELLLEVAQTMLLERGYLGLTMDRIATATGYSKGTIYQHFTNKEDLLVGIMVQGGARRVDFFERAATLRGPTRERITAIGVAVELFAILHPEFGQAEKVVKAASIRAKASEKRMQALESCENRCVSITAGIVRDAVASGDLELRDGDTPEGLVFGLWALHDGAFAIEAMGIPLDRLGIAPPLEALRRAAAVYLDGWGWRPHSHEYDDAAVRARIAGELFAAELASLQRASTTD